MPLNSTPESRVVMLSWPLAGCFNAAPLEPPTSPPSPTVTSGTCTRATASPRAIHAVGGAKAPRKQSVQFEGAPSNPGISWGSRGRGRCPRERSPASARTPGRRPGPGGASHPHFRGPETTTTGWARAS